MSKKDPKDFSEPPFEVYIHAADESVSFESYDSLRDWALHQVELWNPASAIAGVEPNLTQTAWNQTTGHFNNIATQADHAANHADEGVRNQARAAVVDHLALLKMGERTTADSPPGQRILDDVIADPKTAAARLVWAVGGQLGGAQALTPEFRKKLIDVRIEDQIGHNEPHVHKGKLTRLFNDRTRDFASMEDKAYEKTETIRRLAQTILRNQQKEKRRHAEEMVRIEKTFMAEMELRAPATYWASRGVRHAWIAAAAFVAFGVVGGCAAWFLWAEWPELVLLAAAQKEGMGYLPLVLVSLPAVFVFWFLRLISRIFITSLSAVRDAAHRSVMVKTYLALVAEEESGVTEKDRLLILQALFRPENPTADDDAPPPHLLEMMASAAGIKR